MKLKITVFIFSILLIITLGYFVFIHNSEKQNSTAFNNTELTTEHKGKEEGKPKMEDLFFSEWHSPEPAVLSTARLKQIWSQVEKVPHEKDLFDNIGNEWKELGPYGSKVPATQNSKFSGRVRDIRVDSLGNAMIAAATGGLWGSNGNSIYPLSEQVQSLSLGSFDVMPGNSNVIVLGTGEPYRKHGTGLWRTSDGGATWVNLTMGGDIPAYFFKVRFNSANVVHAATNMGYYRSDDAGLTWTKYHSGEVSDIAFNPQNTNIGYLGLWNNFSGQGGIYKTINGGNNWTRLTDGLPPPANMGRITLSLCLKYPDVVYALVSKDDGDTFLKLYKTTDAGANWDWASPPQSAGDILDGIGWYLGSLGVCPTNDSIVLLGGSWLWRSTDGGSNWNMTEFNAQNSPAIHVDQQVIRWSNNGSYVYIGHDGGTAVSTNYGASFSSATNTWPISQYYNFDVSVVNPNLIMGGTQDNGLMGTMDGGNTWNYLIPGGGTDGSAAAFHSSNPSIVYGIYGILPGNLSFGRVRSTDNGVSWTAINSGIEATRFYNPKIRTDANSPVNVYTNAEKNLYYSSNNGTNWLVKTSTPFPSIVTNFAVKTYKGITYTYVCLGDTATGKRLRVQVGSGDFVECSNGIKPQSSIRSITMHPTNPKIAYAVLNGLIDGHKVYMTKDRGVSWSNISGNLPNVPSAGLVVHDKNDKLLYLGSEMGCYKSNDGGVSWIRWNEGMPEANIITEIKSYRNSNDEFHIIACSYGRGIWDRVEPNMLMSGEPEFPQNYKLHQNFPNPFNPTTIIAYDIPDDGLVTLNIYDVTGKKVSSLVNETLEAGEHEIEFNAAGLSSGVYFYSLVIGNFKETKRMLLLK